MLRRSPYLGQGQTQGPTLLPSLFSKFITHHLQPPNPTTAPPPPPSRARGLLFRPPLASPWPRAGPDPIRTAAPPSLGPAHLALHLHGAQAAAARPVPVAAVHAEAGSRSGLLQPGRPPPLGARGETLCAAGRFRTRPRPGRLLTGTCRGAAAARVSAPSSAPLALHSATPRVGLATRRAGTRLPPSGPPLQPRRRRRRRRRRGRSRGDRRRSPALGRHRPREPARAPPRRAGAAARAHLQPPQKPRRLALRPHPIGSAHLRPRRQPIDTRLSCAWAGPSARKSRPPPRDWPRTAREGRDHLKPRPSQKEQGSWTAHARAPEFPPREGRPEAQAHLEMSWGGWAFRARAGARLVPWVLAGT